MLPNKSKIWANVAFATLALATGSASALSVTTNEALSFTDGTSEFGHAFSKDYKGYSFLSNFNFSVGGKSDVTSGFYSIAGRTTDLSFSGFNLYTSAGTLIKQGTNDFFGKTDVWSLSVDNLAVGSYRLGVAGTVLGATGGSFGGNINVSPVPEPATWGMMIAGLTIVGMVVRRRKTNTEPHFAPNLSFK